MIGSMKRASIINIIIIIVVIIIINITNIIIVIIMNIIIIIIVVVIVVIIISIKTCLLVHVGIFVQEESQKVRAETKLDINLENSRISDMVCVFVCVCYFILINKV